MRSIRLPAALARPVLAAFCLAVALGGCATRVPADDPQTPVAQRIARLPPADVLLLGERHDAPEHHRIEQESVQALIAQGRLAALALEMAEQGRSTEGLPGAATEAQVQAALAWDAKAWPWAHYGPAVMAAVRAGVPVVGANLPRARMRDAMADVSLDAQLSDEARAAQRSAVREGHCNRLPEAQILAMTRIQIARDRAMAHTLVQRPRPAGQTLLLITGAGHAVRSRGVPQHLPTDLRVLSIELQAGEAPERAADDFDRIWKTPPLPARDGCDEAAPPMPLRGSPLSRLRREEGTLCGPAEPVPRVFTHGLLRGRRWG